MDDFFGNVTNLLDTADNTISTRGLAVKDGLKKTIKSVRDKFASFGSNKNEQDEIKSLPTVVNCLVKILTDVIEKVTKHATTKKIHEV